MDAASVSQESSNFIDTVVLIERGTWPPSAPWDRYRITPLIQQILDTDGHLKKTCRDVYTLALALEKLALDELAEAVPIDEPAGFDDIVVDHLLQQLFEADYRRRLYIRLYNVMVEDAPAPVELPGLPVAIRTLHRAQIPLITGETTTWSTLHRDDTGDSFMVFEDQGDDDDIAWWTAKWQQAIPIVQALKYVKYAVVDMDYGALHFDPRWVNAVRRPGIGIGGRPRLETQGKRYVLTRDDQRTLVRFLAAVNKHQALMMDEKNTIRRATMTAGDYYEGHHTRSSSADQLIDLVIALEALFGDRRQDLSFRISLATALLIGNTSNEIGQVFDFVRRMYDARSGLVHGGENPFDARREKDRVTADDVARLGEMVREVIIRVAVLYARGEFGRDRTQLLLALPRASFDVELRTRVRTQSDVEAFLAEQGI